MLYALVVIYNDKCENSKTLESLKNYNKNINIIVFDNSNKDFNNKEFCEKNNYLYYTVNKNIGLSKAYNYVLKELLIKKNGYLLVLDDDTSLTKKYLDEIIEKSLLNKYDILLPIVKSNNNIISPANTQFDCRVRSVNNINEIDKKNITAINSGMVIKLSVYNKFLYNENLFLDYVDHEFMRQIRKSNFNITILNSEIIQSFSRDEKGSLASELIRFNIYKKDFKKYCELCNKEFYGYFNILKFTIKQCLKYKTFKFFKKFKEVK